jgi:hypothetical protein
VLDFDLEPPALAGVQDGQNYGKTKPANCGCRRGVVYGDRE